MPTDFLLYKEPDCPVEYALGALSDLKMVWAINPTERLLTFCEAQDVHLANLAAKKQSDLWRWLDKKAARPDLMFIGFHQNTNRLQEFSRTVSLINQYCQKRGIPILLDRSNLLLHEVPWLLDESPATTEDSWYLEVAMAEGYGQAHAHHYKALQGSDNWMRRLSRLPAFMRELAPAN